MKDESPFTLRRFEYERRHLYYLPNPIFKTLEGEKSVFLIGSRGTGKTTLLTALSWEERLRNAELTAVLSQMGADQNCIGIYIKMPETLAGAFDTWIPAFPLELRASVFCLYIDLIWLQSLMEAVAQMLVEKRLDAPPSKERKLTQRVLDRYKELNADARQTGPFSFKRFASLLYEKRRTMEKWALTAAEPEKERLSRAFPLTQIGSFGRDTENELAMFCEDCDQLRHKWHFKICLDESECLSPFQQRALHTAIRLAHAPVSYVVSYVSMMEDMSNTFIKGMSLQEADRELIELDSMNDRVFSDLAEGVATVRIRNSPTGEAIPTFDTRALLGDLDINELLNSILQISAAPEAKAILALAERLSKSPFYIDTCEQSSTLPIYQAYIIDRLALELPAPNSPHWQRRKQDSAEIRKRMVAAYLCLCKELKTRPKYASAEMLFQMSDKCIRDYLNQMDSLFSEANLPLAEFCKRRLTTDQQNAALREASRRKKDSLPKSEVGSPVETGRLIDALGSLTARLQTTEVKSLRASEKGNFVVDTSRQPPEQGEALRILKEASEAGFFKTETPNERRVRFRMHCSLAPAYGFSYRGAYYDCPLGIREIVAIYHEPDSEARQQLVLSIGDRLLQDSPTLFGAKHDGP